MATRNTKQPQQQQPSAVPTRSSSRLKTVPATAKATALPSRTRSTRALVAEPTPTSKPTNRDTKPLAANASASRRAPASKDSTPPLNTVYVQVPSLRGSKDSVKGKAVEKFNEPEREPIKAFLRVRPPPADTPPHSSYLSVISPTTVLMTDPSATNPPAKIRRLTANSPSPSSTYTFTHIFPAQVSQAEFFKATALPLVQDLLKGENGLLFAYGVTNSGKTFTVQGAKDAGQGGLLPRTLDVVFNSIRGLESDANIRPVRLTGVEVDTEVHEDSTDETRPDDTMADVKAVAPDDLLADLFQEDGSMDVDHDETTVDLDGSYEYCVFVSYVEIYNERIYDLLTVDETLSANATGGMTRTNTVSRFPPASAQVGMPRSNTLVSTSNRPGGRLSNMLLPSFSLNANLSALASTNAAVTPVISRKALSLRTDATSPRGGKYVVGMREVRVRSSEEARQVVQMGQINRRVFGTLANKTSSRSHAVFMVRIVRIRKGVDFTKDSTAVHTSRLSVVDLAGSERHKNTQTAGDRLKEAGSINKSLMVLGQCMEVMRANQKRASRVTNDAADSQRKQSGPSARVEKAIVPFWYSKLTELFQDYFEGDGKAAMIVNVNPYDTGFDENTHVMRFAALAREVTTNVAVVKAPTGILTKPGIPTFSGLQRPAPMRRTVSIVTYPSGDKQKQALWEVAEEDEDDPEGEPREDLVDQLFIIVQDLREKLYDAELRFAMAEVEIREEVTREFEERIRVMEATFARRRMNDEEANDAKMDKKIDLLYRAGVLGGNAPIDEEVDEDEEMGIEKSLIADDSLADEISGRSDSPSPMALPKDPVLPVGLEQSSPREPTSEFSEASVTEEEHSDEESETEELEDEEEDEDKLSDDTATDDDWTPNRANNSLRALSDEEIDAQATRTGWSSGGPSAPKGKTDAVKTAANTKATSSKPKPKPVPLATYDVSMDDIPVVKLKRSKSSKARTSGAVTDSEESAGDNEVLSESDVAGVIKKKKRLLGTKALVTEDDILAVAQRVEEGARVNPKGRVGSVRRMVS